ncbi:MAG: hypothetical protein M3O15_16010 [Acidobacteriota bacterium]|nr:hypothetical protein [Acidobacteriota bacterium]
MVAAPEPEAAATRLELKPAPEPASLSEEQALELAIAALLQEPSYRIPA